MSHWKCHRVLSVASIFLCLYIIPQPSEAKCRGQWSLQACMGGNGKRSSDIGRFSRADVVGDSLFLKRLLADEMDQDNLQDDEREQALAEDSWPEETGDVYQSQSPRREVVNQLLHILSRLKQAKDVRDAYYTDKL